MSSKTRPIDTATCEKCQGHSAVQACRLNATSEPIASDFSFALTPEEQAELDEAMKSWIPYWRKPLSPDEWDKLVSQRYSFAATAIESHKSGVASNAPLFLRQMLAKSRHQMVWKYCRTKRRAEAEKVRACQNLLAALGLRLPE